MLLIPVLDLKDGHVVHAKKGQRAHYHAIDSALGTGSDPQDFTQIFVENFAVDFLYIADLNAISGSGNNFDTINSLLRQYPGLTIYLDAGIELLDEKIYQLSNCIPVLGSENQINAGQLQSYNKKYSPLILSLDFNEKGFWGDKDILNTPAVWPEQIILMNLDRVGSKQGLNLERLDKIRHLSPTSQIYFAGGIQNQKDIEILKNHGINGVLLATALHDGSIKADFFKSKK